MPASAQAVPEVFLKRACELVEVDPGRVSGFDVSFNMRDLGGHKTVDGRRVKHGLLFRSGELARADHNEMLVISCIGLKYVVDLRTKAEAAAAPDPRLPGVTSVRISGYLDRNGKEVDLSPGRAWRLILKPRHRCSSTTRNPKANWKESMVAGVYASLAFDNVAFRELFTLLEDDDVPLLFHCSAGKDRSGVAAMLILLALGVPAKEVVADFALSNAYRASNIMGALQSHPLLARLPLGNFILCANEGVIEECGHRMIREIVHAYGTLERFFEAEYGLTAERLSALRDRYLEA